MAVALAKNLARRQSLLKSVQHITKFYYLNMVLFFGNLFYED